MTPIKAEINPNGMFSQSHEGTGFYWNIWKLTRKAESRLGYEVEGIQVDEGEQTAHLVFNSLKGRAVLLDNGKNEAILCGETRQKNFFTGGWYYSVNWGGNIGEREYCLVYRTEWGKGKLIFPKQGGYFLKISDLEIVSPEKMAELWEALKKVTNQGPGE